MGDINHATFLRMVQSSSPQFCRSVAARVLPFDQAILNAKPIFLQHSPSANKALCDAKIISHFEALAESECDADLTLKLYSGLICADYINLMKISRNKNRPMSACKRMGVHVQANGCVLVCFRDNLWKYLLDNIRVFDVNINTSERSTYSTTSSQSCKYCGRTADRMCDKFIWLVC